MPVIYLLMLLGWSDGHVDLSKSTIVGRLPTYEQCAAEAIRLNKPMMGNPFYCVAEPSAKSN